MLGLTGSIALQVGSNQCLQKAHLRPPVLVKSAVTIIAMHHLYLFAIFLKTCAAYMRIITNAQALTIVPLKAVVKILNTKRAISPAKAHQQKTVADLLRLQIWILIQQQQTQLT